MAFESSAVPEDWRSVVTVPLNKGKSHSVGRPWKRWINTVKDCLKKERERGGGGNFRSVKGCMNKI